jgi:hypothetical protein
VRYYVYKDDIQIMQRRLIVCAEIGQTLLQDKAWQLPASLRHGYGKQLAQKLW